MRSDFSCSSSPRVGLPELATPQDKKARNAITHDSGCKIIQHDEWYNKGNGPTIVFHGGWRRGCARGGATAGGRVAVGNAPWSSDLHERRAAGHSGHRLRWLGAGAAQKLCRRRWEGDSCERGAEHWHWSLASSGDVWGMKTRRRDHWQQGSWQGADRRGVPPDDPAAANWTTDLSAGQRPVSQ